MLLENVKQQVNQISINNGELPIDADMLIPRGVIEKWGGNRMAEKYSPERIAQIADEVFHSPNVKVSEGRFSHIQKIIKERPEHSNDFYGFISKDKNNGKTTIKTIYEKRRSSAGRQPTSLQDNPAGRMRFSDLQTSSSKTKQAASDVVLGSRDVASTATQPVYAYNMADLRGNFNSKNA